MSHVKFLQRNISPTEVRYVCPLQKYIYKTVDAKKNHQFAFEFQIRRQQRRHSSVEQRHRRVIYEARNFFFVNNKNGEDEIRQHFCFFENLAGDFNLFGNLLVASQIHILSGASGCRLR